MRCIDEGTLRSYLDGALQQSEMAAIETHVTECAACAILSNGLATTARDIAERLAVSGRSPQAGLALSRMHARLAREHQSRWSRTSLARYRLAFGGLAAALVTALLVLTPMRMVAADLLAVFRVQKFAAVTIDPSLLPILPNPGKLGDVQMGGKEGAREVSLAEAAQNVDFPIRQAGNVPAALGQPRVFLSNPVDVSYKVDLAALKAYLAKVGAQDTQLPTALEGATLRARMPASVAFVYGMNSSGQSTAGGQFLVVGESRGPTVEVPDDVDVDLLREQVLAIPILPPELVGQLRAIKDWRHTMVIPVPSGAHRDVTVNGVPGLLIDQGQVKTLLWQKDGVLYALASSLSEGDLMRIAGSLK